MQIVDQAAGGAAAAVLLCSLSPPPVNKTAHNAYIGSQMAVYGDLPYSLSKYRHNLQRCGRL